MANEDWTTGSGEMLKTLVRSKLPTEVFETLTKEPDTATSKTIQMIFASSTKDDMLEAINLVFEKKL